MRSTDTRGTDEPDDLEPLHGDRSDPKGYTDSPSTLMLTVIGLILITVAVGAGFWTGFIP